ncbi:MAG: threonylcarbamoyl-AMP synthase [Chlamydiae bacterium]|nr:threonylcarbamoyl-AMP synthase [Chlamydiota bacterium]
MSFMETEISKNIDKAAQLLNQGHLVAIPTETVYGLAGLFGSIETYNQIYEVKGRPSDNPLIVHIGEKSWIYDLIDSAPTSLEILLDHFFPGPLTLILKKAYHISPSLTANLPTIAIRMPSHPLALELLRKVGHPIVAPSANLSGCPSPTRAEDVLEDFNGKIPMILDGGPCQIGIESTVLSLLDNKPCILRPGIITEEAIENVLQTKLGSSGKEVLSPGMKYRHYAPKAKVSLIYPHDSVPFSSGWVLSFENELKGAIPFNHQNFYQLLRKADRENISHVFIFVGPILSKEKALMNRIQKSAGG